MPDNNHTHEHSGKHDGHNHHHHSGDGHEESLDILLIARLGCTAVLFLLGLFVSVPDWMRLIVFGIAFLIIGYDVTLNAVTNLIQGHVFDEHFLMTIASLGAFAIGEAPEGVAVMFLFQLGEALHERAIGNSRKSITSLLDLRPETVNMIVDGKTVTLPAEDVSVGSIITIAPGERIPLDGLVIDGISEMDTSALTGESLPRSVTPGESALSGCINLSGVLTVRVTAELKDSTVSRILELIENADSNKTKSEKFITRFSKVYTPFVVCATFAIGILVPLIGRLPFYEWIHRALVFLVISCPCALVISVPLTYFAGIGRASKKGILFKGSEVLDTLAMTASVIFDKTGTLTTGGFMITEVEPVGISTDELMMLAAYAEALSTHPIARSIVEAYNGEIDKRRITKYHEQRGRGVVAQLDDRLTIAAGNEPFMAEIGVYPNVDSRGKSAVFVAVGSQYAGRIIIGDSPKKDAAKAIQALSAINIDRIAIFTGDRKEAADALASQIGIMEVHAECLPEDKVDKLRSLCDMQLEGDKLVYVGDGINDAPVLATADVGIAMGAFGSDAAIEAADVVIMTDEPSKVAEAIRIARNTKQIVIQNIIFSLSAKAVFMLMGLFGKTTMWMAVFADVGVSILATLNAMRAYDNGSFAHIKNNADTHPIYTPTDEEQL